ncbi:DUF4339 domain-containing protein, partial [bacterium]|nr:DUF4339 domain-containing protein [bacterium]
MSTTPHQWFYMKKTVLSEDQVGPVSEAELKDLIFSGKMKPDTRLSSPSRTKGQWRVMKSIPTLLKLYESGIADRENQKVVEKQAKAAAKLSDNEIKRKSNLKPAPRRAKASAETNSKKPKKLVLIIGFGCILPAFLVFVVTAIFVYLAIRPTPPVPPVFSKSVDVDQATVMT